MTVMPILVSVLGTVRNGLKRRLKEVEIKGRKEIKQTPALLRAARMHKNLQETWSLAFGGGHTPLQSSSRQDSVKVKKNNSPVSRGSKIHRLYLCSG